VTITWPICSARAVENRPGAAGPALKAVLLGTESGRGPNPAGHLEPDAGAAAGHDDLPGRVRPALGASGGHDSS